MIETKNPPCHEVGKQPNACAFARYDRMIHNKAPLYGEWTGWRMAGRHLVAPNGVRFSPKELDAIAWARKHAELRERKAERLADDQRRQELDRRVIVLASVTPARERFAGCA